MAEKQKKLSKKDIILREAEKIFAEKGYYNTSVRDIAQAAGSNIAMLYYYFEDKEALYFEILDSTFKKVFEIMSESMEQKATHEEKIRAFISSYIQFLGSKQDTGRIIAWEMAEGGKSLPHIAEKYVSKGYAALQSTFRAGMSEGQFNELDLELAPLSMLGMIIFFFFSAPLVKRVLHRERYDREFLERLASHTTDMFLKGLLKEKL